MTKKQGENIREEGSRTIKDLVNTPFKRVMLVVQITSYVLIVGSPLIGGALGGIFKLSTPQSGGLILGIFILGEVLFYASLLFLGKEIVLLLRDQIKRRFQRKKKLNTIVLHNLRISYWNTY